MEANDNVICPYDKSHSVRKSRLPRHLMICSKNHQDANMKRCNYNACHVVKANQFEKHLLECPDRELAKPSTSNEDTHDAPHILPINPNQNDTSDDWGTGEWDNEACAQTYKPLEAIQDRPIVYAQIGLSKNRRRNHRNNEKKRFNETSEGK